RWPLITRVPVASISITACLRTSKHRLTSRVSFVTTIVRRLRKIRLSLRKNRPEHRKGLLQGNQRKYQQLTPRLHRKRLRLNAQTPPKTPSQYHQRHRPPVRLHP